jgi:hypothetical protein
VVVCYDPAIAITAGLRRPGRFAKFLSPQPDLMKPEVGGCSPCDLSRQYYFLDLLVTTAKWWGSSSSASPLGLVLALPLTRTNVI